MLNNISDMLMAYALLVYNIHNQEKLDNSICLIKTNRTTTKKLKSHTRMRERKILFYIYTNI